MTTKYRHILAAVVLVLALCAPFVYCLGLGMELVGWISIQILVYTHNYR